MTQKERLVNLMLSYGNAVLFLDVDVMAQMLLDNGVIVPPCKVGDTVFYNSLTETHEVVVSSLSFDIDFGDEIYVIGHDEYFKDGEVCIDLADCENRLFKTREAAEQAHEARKKEREEAEQSLKERDGK